MKKIYLIFVVLLTSHLSFSQTANPPAAGNGTESNPYAIETLQNLYWLSQNSSFWDANYIQTANIDASATSEWSSTGGDGFPPIGTESEPFTGVYDGDNYTISNLYINRASDYIGLFGYVGDFTLGGSISNLVLENVNITAPSGGDWWFTGAMVGYIKEGEIDNCHTSGTIQAEYIAGGLAGSIDNSVVSNSSSSCNITGLEDLGGFSGDISFSVVSNCKATGDVSGISWVAGFAGYNDSEIYNCYATGNVSGENYLGGFVGQHRNAAGNPIISNCYAWGNVLRVSGAAGEDIGGFAGNCDDNSNTAVEITNSYSIGVVNYADVANPTDKGFVGSEAGTNTYTGNFYDYVTSGQTSGLGATSQLTAAMQTMSTFTDANWDFMGETTNGTDDIWGINQNENNGYPFLKWQGYKLQPDVSEWPVVSFLECSESLVAAELTGGSASVSGSFTFVEPEIIPPLGTSQQQLQFVPDDTDTYEIVVAQREITVEDTQVPIPYLAELPDITAECEVNSLSKPTATDACSGTIEGVHDVDLPILTQGNYTVTWTYDDGNGNIAVQEQTVLVEDSSQPVITCPAEQSINLESGQSVYTVSGTEFDPTEASDNCELASVLNDFNDAETLDGYEFPEGTTTVIWTALDIAGNTQSCSFDVTVNAAVGLKETTENYISIYPNPTDGRFFVENADGYRCTIVNISGKVVFKGMINSDKTEIELRSLSPGIYFSEFANNKKVIYKELIVR
jgi:hypothetical protein